MGNCLKTQLKEAVSNPSLYKLGEIRILTSAVDNPNYSSNRKVLIESAESIKLSIVSGSGHFTDSTGQADYGTEKTVTNETVYVSNNDCVISVPNKYKISKLEMGSNLWVNVSDINYLGIYSGKSYINFISLSSKTGGTIDFSSLPPVGNFRLTGATNIVGDITPLEIVHVPYVSEIFDISGGINLVGTPVIPADRIGTIGIFDSGIVYNIENLINPNCSNLSLNTKGVTGNANVFFGNYSRTILASLVLRDSKVTGDLEIGVAKLWSNGKRSGTFTYTIPRTMNLNGSPSSVSIHVCEFSDNGVVVKANSASGNILATYDGSTWTYNS